jgi:tRNA dimethylallyltransferase
VSAAAPHHPPGEREALFLAGPTGVGKSAVALELAARLGGEIISVDSMQVYRGLDIGTGKPSPADRRRVPHHLVDVVALTEAFDAWRYVTLARQAEEDIRRRGRPPIFCGGTGLYFKSYLEGLGAAPASDPAVRRELEALPLSALLAELEARDPAAHASLDRANRRRVVRALEMVRSTGQPLSMLRARQARSDRRPMVLGLSRAPEDLRRRIDARVEAMFRAGWVEETRRLAAEGLEGNRTAMQAIGYRQILEHLRGGLSWADTVALVQQKTRQFARRQRTWFRHQLEVQWCEVSPDEESRAVADRIADLWQGGVLHGAAAWTRVGQ